MIFNWFKYLKRSSSSYVDTPPEYDFSRIILNSSKWNNPLVFWSHRPINDHKSSFKWRIDYCGAFYFFIRYLRKKQKHYENDIKPVFIQWAELTIQPLDYHYSSTFDALVIPIIDTIHGMDHDDMAYSHLEGYKEYDLLLLIAHHVRKYNTSLHNFINDITGCIESDITALVPTVSKYNSEQPQKSNYYFLSNILKYLWNKFWEEKAEYRMEIEGNELIQIPGKDTICLSDNRTNLKKLKEYIDGITNETVYTLLSFEIERNHIVKLVDDFRKSIYLIERDIRWNKGLKGRCGWERNFWGRWDVFNRLMRRHDPTVNSLL